MSSNPSRPASGATVRTPVAASPPSRARPATPAARLAAGHGVAGAGLDRRGFLRTTAGGAVAITVASLLPAGCSADYPQAEADGASLATLSPKEYAVVKAAAEALLVDVPVEPKDVASAIDAELAAAGEPIQSDMKNVLRLIEHFTILSLHRHTFTELDPAARLRYLQGWATSRFAVRRGAFQAIRGFVQYFAYIEPATRAITGFAGPLSEHVTVPPVRTVDYGEIA
jgi:hypothetical protein